MIPCLEIQYTISLKLYITSKLFKQPVNQIFGWSYTFQRRSWRKGGGSGGTCEKSRWNRTKIQKRKERKRIEEKEERKTQKNMRLTTLPPTIAPSRPLPPFYNYSAHTLPTTLIVFTIYG